MFTKIVYSESIVYNTVVIIHKILNNYSLYRNNSFSKNMDTVYILRRKQNRRNAGGGVQIWRAAWPSVSPPDLRGRIWSCRMSSPVPVVPVGLPCVVSGRLAHSGASPCRACIRGDGYASGALRVPFRRRCAHFAHAVINRCVRVFAFLGLYIIYNNTAVIFNKRQRYFVCSFNKSKKHEKNGLTDGGNRAIICAEKKKKSAKRRKKQ